MNKDIWKNLLKFLIVFIIYIFYGKLFGLILSLIGIGGLLASFIMDLLFFIGIIWFYRKNLKEDFREYKKYTWKKILKIILGNFGLILLVFMIMGMLTEIFVPEAANIATENNQMITSLFNASLLYTLFKTLIFATIAEELVFREAISEAVTNKKVLVIISSSIYALMNIIYVDLSHQFIWMDFLQYFLFYMILSLSYVKHNNNIFVPISIKFLYNLFQIILLIVVSVAK